MTSKDWAELEAALAGLWIDPDKEKGVRRLRDLLLDWIRKQNDKARRAEKQAAREARLERKLDALASAPEELFP